MDGRWRVAYLFRRELSRTETEFAKKKTKKKKREEDGADQRTALWLPVAVLGHSISRGRERERKRERERRDSQTRRCLTSPYQRRPSDFTLTRRAMRDGPDAIRPLARVSPATTWFFLPSFTFIRFCLGPLWLHFSFCPVLTLFYRVLPSFAVMFLRVFPDFLGSLVLLGFCGLKLGKN